MSGYLCTTQTITTTFGESSIPTLAKVYGTIFVVSGWLLSLIFHEFAHAYVAWKGGDVSVAAKGYLTLDPRRYTNPFLSLIIPVIIVLIGGIGLPGGAVWIDQTNMTDERKSAVSAAGPAATLVCAFLTILPISLGLLTTESSVLYAAVALLAFVQFFAFLINMLPIPGLDGFGILEPTLPENVNAMLAPIRAFGFIIFLVILFYTPFIEVLVTPIIHVVEFFGIENDGLRDGFDLLPRLA